MGSLLVSDLLSEDGNGKQQTPASVFSYTEQFYLHLPFYLSIGMTHHQYWDEDCCLTKYFYKAYKIRRDRKNWEAWLHGMYIYEALCDVSPILRAFAKNGTKPEKYSSEPYELSDESKEKNELREKAKCDAMKNKMSAFAARFNLGFEEKGEEDGHDN